MAPVKPFTKLGRGSIPLLWRKSRVVASSERRACRSEKNSRHWREWAGRRDRTARHERRDAIVTGKVRNLRIRPTTVDLVRNHDGLVRSTASVEEHCVAVGRESERVVTVGMDDATKGDGLRYGQCNLSSRGSSVQTATSILIVATNHAIKLVL